MTVKWFPRRELVAAVAGQDHETVPAVSGQESRNQKYVTLSQPKMLGPILPASRGGNARRSLALAFCRHRTGDSFQEDDPERTHHGGGPMKKSRPPAVVNDGNKNDETQRTVYL
ncbi:MAG: hypothetical protein ABSF60_09455 [Verrucomicrobiota bacterium]|jgi:hypothetical protein